MSHDERGLLFLAVAISSFCAADLAPKGSFQKAISSLMGCAYTVFMLIEFGVLLYGVFA